MGIILGICAVFSLNYFISYSQEILRFISFLKDPLILSDRDYTLYDLFFAAFSTSLGFGVTIAYWLSGKNKYNKKEYLKVFVISNSSFISIAAFTIVAKFGSNLAIVPFGLRGYDNQLDLIQNHQLLLILIPIYIFFSHWIAIRLIFRIKHWIPISLFICISIGFISFKTTYVDRDILNEAHYHRNIEKYDYIENEFIQARQIGIIFSDSIKQILQKEYAERTHSLVSKLKASFSKNDAVPLDILILEKIVIRNLKRQYYYSLRNQNDKDINWSYAFPDQIYYQIKKHDPGSHETKLLFEILHEQIMLFNIKEIYDDRVKDYSLFKREQYWYKRELLRHTSTIQSRLIQVTQKLKSDSRYERFHHLLQNIEFDDNKGHQVYYELDLDDE